MQTIDAFLQEQAAASSSTHFWALFYHLMLPFGMPAIIHFWQAECQKKVAYNLCKYTIKTEFMKFHVGDCNVSLSYLKNSFLWVAFLQIFDKKDFFANDTLMTNLFGLDTLPSLM